MLSVRRYGRQGSVWVANAFDNSVSQMNPMTVSVVAAITVGRRPSGVALGDGSRRVSNEADDSVHRIDTASRPTVATIPVGDGPTAVAYGAGSVRVANGAEKRLTIDPRTNRVANILVVGNRPSGVAVGADGIWVTFQAPLD